MLVSYNGPVLSAVLIRVEVVVAVVVYVQDVFVDCLFPHASRNSLTSKKF